MFIPVNLQLKELDTLCWKLYIIMYLIDGVYLVDVCTSELDSKTSEVCSLAIASELSFLCGSLFSLEELSLESAESISMTVSLISLII